MASNLYINAFRKDLMFFEDHHSIDYDHLVVHWYK